MKLSRLMKSIAFFETIAGGAGVQLGNIKSPEPEPTKEGVAPHHA